MINRFIQLYDDVSSLGGDVMNSLHFDNILTDPIKNVSKIIELRHRLEIIVDGYQYECKCYILLFILFLTLLLFNLFFFSDLIMKIRFRKLTVTCPYPIMAYYAEFGIMYDIVKKIHSSLLECLN